MEYLLLIFVVYLLVRLHSLSARIDKLEKGTAHIPSLPPTPTQTNTEPQDTYDTALHQAIFYRNQAPVHHTPSFIPRLTEWLKEDWILKLGAFLLLIGFGWLTTYAFINNWIGPQGRITLGLFAGTLILILGFWRINKYIHQGGIFLVLGSTTILLTIYAAREIYNFFTPTSALSAMFITTAFVAFASVRYKTQSLALASMTLAALAPLFTNTPKPDYEGLFIYLLIVTIGAIWIVILTGWRTLTAAALVLISLYSLPHLFSFIYVEDYSALLMLSFAFAALFYTTNTSGILKAKEGDIQADLITAGGTGLFLLSWILIAAPDVWKSLLISAWVLIFTIGAFIIFRKTGRREPFYVYAGVAIAMLGAATAQEASGATLTFFYTIESLMIVIVAQTFLKDMRVSERLSYLLAIPMMLSSSSVSSNAWATGILHKDFFALLLLSVVSFVLGLLFTEWQKQSSEKEHTVSDVFYLIGSLYSFVVIWKSFHALLPPDTAVMLSLLIYTCTGLVLYFQNIETKNPMRTYGGVILGFVILRLLTIDVWNMDITGKIVTFLLIGALLMSTAFIGKKKKEAVIEPQRPE